MLLIGDVHGKINKYWSILQKYKDQRSVQVGDFGFQKQHDWHIEHIDSSQHKIVFGNHDYYPYVYMNHSYGDFHSEEIDGLKYFFVRGAKSIDAQMRTEGLDWFREEELRYGIWRELLDAYAEVQPDVVVSHDCPNTVKNSLFKYGYDTYSLTNHLLQECFEIYQPLQWFFGHHHKSKNELINGTSFHCLAELETYEL